MNDRERAFFARMSESRLTPNQARLLFGLLGGKTLRQVGLPATSLERTVTELRKMNLVEKVDGRWRLSGDVAGIFDLHFAVAGKSLQAPPPNGAIPPTAAVPRQPQSPPTVQPTDATVNRPGPHPFLRRPGVQIVQVCALLELAGVDPAGLRMIENLAIDGGQPPASLLATLDRAESIAARRFPN